MDDIRSDIYVFSIFTADHQGKRNRNVKFAFDNVYAPSSATEDIFQEVINPMLDTLLSGYNCSVFAYGATGYFFMNKFIAVLSFVKYSLFVSLISDRGRLTP